MKVTFTRDHKSPASGNEFYRKGAQADLVKGQALIDAGVAHAGWDKPTPEKIDDVAPASAMLEPIDYRSLTKTELIDVAKEKGIAYIGQTKAKLLDALNEAE